MRLSDLSARARLLNLGDLTKLRPDHRNMSTRTSRVRTPVPRCTVPEDFRLFAIESIEKVVEIARTVSNSNKAAASFCGSLSGVLWSIKTHLQKPSQVQDEAHKKKVESLLNNLERLCSVCPCSVGSVLGV